MATNDSTKKLKYITNPTILQPLIPNTKNDFDVAGTRAHDNGDLGYFQQINVESELKYPKPTPDTVKSNDGRTFYMCNNRVRNLDTSGYIPTADRVSTGFGNIEVMNQMQFGTSTRLNQAEIRDAEIDRFHPTYHNYQSDLITKLPFPADTRYLNKRFYL